MSFATSPSCWFRFFANSTHKALPRRAACAAFSAASSSSPPSDPLGQERKVKHYLRFGAKMYAEPRKFEKGHGGEDAYFVSEEHPSFGRRRGGSKEEEPVTHQAFGVADGVGDWVFVRGVDSSLFSHRLMELSKLLFETEPASSPAAVLGQSYELIQTEDIEGSSTVCIANFCRTTAILSIANLGDSGLFVIRDGTVAFETKHQNHIFGVPFQLSSDFYRGTGSSGSGYEREKRLLLAAQITAPVPHPVELTAKCTVAELKAELRKKGLKVSGRKQDLVERLAKANEDSAQSAAKERDLTAGKFYNLPSHADEVDVWLQRGDVVVAATDGFFDNVDPHEVAGDIWKVRSMGASDLAKMMARHALEVSRGGIRGIVDTPFSRQAQEEMNMIYKGGKMDDITVVVAKVF